MHNLITSKDVDVFDKSKISTGDVVVLTFIRSHYKDSWRNIFFNQPDSYRVFALVQDVVDEYVDVVLLLSDEEIERINDRYTNTVLSNLIREKRKSQREKRIRIDMLGGQFDMEIALRCSNLLS